jgi:hypothetical protein
MRHAIRYEGGFERNFIVLAPGAVDFQGDDGERHTMTPWPADVDGLRFSFMERRGKRFIVVRVQYGATDIVLPHTVEIDATRHLGGRRLGPEPLLITDISAGSLLTDILDANPDRHRELAALRDQVRQSLAGSPAANQSAGPRP